MPAHPVKRRVTIDLPIDTYNRLVESALKRSKQPPTFLEWFEANRTRLAKEMAKISQGDGGIKAANAHPRAEYARLYPGRSRGPRRYSDAMSEIVHEAIRKWHGSTAAAHGERT